MSKKIKIVIGSVAAAALVAVLTLIILIRVGVLEEHIFAPAEVPPTASLTVTESPHPDNTENDEKFYTLSFVGDCTLAGSRFQSLSGGKADYPFSNVADIFSGDEATIANLECNFSDAQLYSDSLFSFKAPTENAKMLISGCIDFVTTANNHTDDFGSRGLEDTFDTLDDIGIPYGKDGECTLFTTQNGLVLGFYCANRPNDAGKITNAVNELKSAGAEYIICAFHWGKEGSYRPNADQKSLAHAAIDAGADVVYGSHPHVLQPVEEYGGGIIMYSLGNFSFGGNSAPRDYDSVIAQITLRRDESGLSLCSYELLPCSISSVSGSNDYRPVLYETDSKEYDRAMSKLDGSFTGADLVVDYSFMRPSPSPEPETDPDLPVVSPVPDGNEVTPLPSTQPVESAIPVPEPIEPPLETG